MSLCAAGTTWSQQAYLKLLTPTRVTGSAMRWRYRATRWWSGVLGVQRGHRGERQPERQQRFRSRCGVCLCAQRHDLEPAAISKPPTPGWVTTSASRWRCRATRWWSGRGGGQRRHRVNGNQNDNSAGTAGAAYVFVRSGATWSQQAYLKASNTGPGDNFGIGVRCRATRW